MLEEPIIINKLIIFLAGCGIVGIIFLIIHIIDEEQERKFKNKM